MFSQSSGAPSVIISFCCLSSSEDMYAQDSIDFLRKSGLDFARHNRVWKALHRRGIRADLPCRAQEGIDVKEFAEVLMMSGVVLSDDVTW